MKRILRVFPKRTSYTPTDDLAFVGPPPMAEFIPEHDEVHVSCTFTWDMDAAEDLAYQWEGATNKPVKLGGPAYHSPCEDFTPGLYVKKGIIFTSRGCNNNCPWCGVRRIEGGCENSLSHRGTSYRTTTFCNARGRTRTRCSICCARKGESVSAAGWRRT